MRPESNHLSERVLSALLDGELGFLEVREARLHLEQCGPCRGNVEKMTEIDCRIALARNRGRPRPGLLAGLLGVIRAGKGDGRSRRRVTPRRYGVPGFAAAAAAILIGLAWLALPPGNDGGREESPLALSPPPGVTHWPAPHTSIGSPGVPLPLAVSSPASPCKTSPRPAGPARAPSLTDLATPVAAPPPRIERPPPAAPRSLEFVWKRPTAEEAPPAPQESLLAAANPSPVGEPPSGTKLSPTAGPPQGAQTPAGGGPMTACLPWGALNLQDPKIVYDWESRSARDSRGPVLVDTEEVGSWRNPERDWTEPSEERAPQVASFVFPVHFGS